MERFKLWDKKSNVNVMGNVMTPVEFKTAFPMQTDGECVLEYMGQTTVGGVDNLFVFANVHKVSMDNKTAQEVLDEIIYKIENPPIPEPTAEDRIASAMEFQNLMSM